MKFLLDENMELGIAVLLHNLGHDVAVVGRDYSAGTRDEDVLAIAVREQRIVLTNDRDFGELVVRLGFPHAGVVYLRIPSGAVGLKQARLAALLSSNTEISNQFIVLSERSIRRR